jgi:hypothetical protein
MDSHTIEHYSTYIQLEPIGCNSKYAADYFVIIIIIILSKYL